MPRSRLPCSSSGDGDGDGDSDGDGDAFECILKSRFGTSDGERESVERDPKPSFCFEGGDGVARISKSSSPSGESDSASRMPSACCGSRKMGIHAEVIFRRSKHNVCLPDPPSDSEESGSRNPKSLGSEERGASMPNVFFLSAGGGELMRESESSGGNSIVATVSCRLSGRGRCGFRDFATRCGAKLGSLCMEGLL